MTTDADVLRQGPAAWAWYVAERRSEDPAWVADLRGVDLYDADLPNADLRNADLRGADLRDARMDYALLRRADLRGADLRGARMDYALLRRADMRGANLRGASCYFARLDGADLREADLRDAQYWVPEMLRANWGSVSDALCVQLMALEAKVLPHGIRRMDEWARGGDCPFDGTAIPRVAHFFEDPSVWPPGGPAERWSMWQIWERLAAEKGVRI